MISNANNNNSLPETGKNEKAKKRMIIEGVILFFVVIGVILSFVLI